MGAVIGVGCSLVANAIWNEVAPERGWGKQLLLRILSLGLVQTKDATYREAARGLAERSSDEVLWIVVFFIFLAVAILLRMLSWDITGNRPKPQEKPTVASSAKRKALFYITAPVTFLLGLSLLWLTQMYRYAHAVGVHFRQSITIVKPFLEKDEVDNLEADFAAMGSASDFVKIDESLHKTADKNHRRLPEFSVW
jgi:NADH:ubiquinone oxidoreductase subunit 6 (subunit J)